MTVTYAEAIAQALADEMAADEAVFLIGEDIGESGGVFGATKGLFERFGPSRVLDTPISEEAVVGAAVGAALVGAHPVVEIMFGDFVALAMDMLVNQAAKIHYMTGGGLSCPLVVRVVTGTAGATAAQHSQSLEGWFTHVPGLKVVAPSTPDDAYGLLRSALRDPDPVLFFEHKLLYGQRHEGDLDRRGPFPALGSAKVRRPGSDVTVVAYLETVRHALQAAEELEAEGVSCEVLDARSLVPFDRSALRASLAKTGRLVVAHEAPKRSGFGAEIVAFAAEECFDLLKGPPVRACGLNTPMPYAPEMEGAVVPNAARIKMAVLDLVARSAAPSQVG